MALGVIHRGKCGDVIYAMAAFRGLHQEKGEKVTVYLADNPLFRFPADEAKRVIPLLKSQTSYIEDAVYVGDHPPPETPDLLMIAADAGESHHVPSHINTARYACQLLGVSEAWAQQPWLTVPKEDDYPAVFNRTTRNQNAWVWWPEIVADNPDGRFVGLSEEYQSFSAFVDADYMHGETPDLLAVAKIIAGAKVFIGNQSAPLAIAHGLHRPVIVEVARRYPNAIFKRANTCYRGVNPAVVDKHGW